MRGERPLLILAFAFFSLALYALLALHSPVLTKESVEIKVPKGASFKEVLRDLREKGLIKNPWILYLYGRLSQKDSQIKAGHYLVEPFQSPKDLFELLSQGKGLAVKVTIPEGLTLREVAEKLKEKGLIDSEQDFLALCQDEDFIRSLGLEALSLEGYLFPDTYYFDLSARPEEIVKVMVENFLKKWDPSFSKRAKELGLTEYEVLILASIIEKEALLSEEKPLISAVFHNRLKRRMPLCADPTVIYGLKQSYWNFDLKRKHLKTPTPYNTYLLKGLPPTPICNPGLGSIKAALYPAKVPYLYFVSRNDGSHYFSTTYKEHLEAVYLYQKGGLKAQAQSTGVDETQAEFYPPN